MPTSFPLQGRLISGPELDAWLRHAIATTRQEAWLCSAFVKSAAFRRLLEAREFDEPLRATVLVRWQVQDLLSGASDLGLFPVCQERNIDLYVKLDFHGKVYAVPPAGIGVGSANATASGLGFGPQPNAEVNTLVACTDENLHIVQGLFAGATRVTEGLYQSMRYELDGMQHSDNLGINQWSSDIMSLMQPPVPPHSLLVDECLLTDGRWWAKGAAVARDNIMGHDLQLLGATSSMMGEVALQAALRRTKCVRWLLEQLRRAPQREMYFGALTAAMHDALLDDPGPRRSEVKALLQNLLSWVQLAHLPELRVDRPNHSQRVSLLTADA